MSINEKMTILADAVRAKSGTEEKLTIDGMTAAVSSLSVGGTDTSDATAEARDILVGKTAYTASGKVNGSMPRISELYLNYQQEKEINAYVEKVVVSWLDDTHELTVTPSEIQQQFLFGLYKNVIVEPIPEKYKDTSRATATEADLRRGKIAYNKDGKITGTLEQITLYKCAYSNPSDKTWTGYKAVLTNGVYSFEETETFGLTYGNPHSQIVTRGYVPVVGNVYNDDATIMAKIWMLPTDGLVFYAPFKTQFSSAETGQTLVTQGDEPSFVNRNGIPCMRIQNTRIDTAENSGITGDGPITLSAWLMDVGGGNVTSAVNNGDNSGASMVAIGASGGRAFCSGYGEMYDWTSYESNLQDRIHHVLCTYGDGVIRMYVDGQKVLEEYTDISMQPNTLCIGSAHGSYYFNGYIGHVRMYNRVLTEDEITTLANEFTPVG